MCVVHVSAAMLAKGEGRRRERERERERGMEWGDERERGGGNRMP